MALRTRQAAKGFVTRSRSQVPGSGKRPGQMRLTPLWLAGLLAAMAACGNATPAPRPPATAPAVASASASRQATAPQDGVVPELRTGALDPVDSPAVRELC